MKAFDAIRWSQAVACSEFGIHPKTLTARIKQYGIEPGDDGRFSTKQIATAIYGDISGEKLQKVRAERELLQLRLATEKSDLVRVESVEKLWSSVVQAMRAIILGSKLSEEEREELFLKLRDVAAAEYRKQRTEEKNETQD